MGKKKVRPRPHDWRETGSSTNMQHWRCDRCDLEVVSDSARILDAAWAKGEVSGLWCEEVADATA